MNRQIRFAHFLIIVIATLVSLAFPQLGEAHPMGNFSISHYAAIRIQSGYVEVRYFIDMAEIPTYQEVQTSGIIAQNGDPSLAPYLVQEAAALRGGLLLEINGTRVELIATNQSALFTPGAGSLPTMKLGIVYRAMIQNLVPGAAHQIHYVDQNFAGHTGWKEIIVNEGDRVSLINSSAPAVDRSAELSNYPTDLLNSPPQDLEANVSFSISPLSAVPDAAPKPDPQRKHTSPDLSSRSEARLSAPGVDLPPTVSASVPATMLPSTPRDQDQRSQADQSTSRVPIKLQANQQQTPRSKFTELVSGRNVGFWFLFPAALIAASLGALHALEPGHGKTIVAAYLVGSRGTPRHAVLLGLIVTAAHTAGVYLLGVITLYASRWIVPEQLYPWLAVISGLMIAGLASYMLLRAWTGEAADHSHEPGQSHTHWFAFLANRGAAEADVSVSVANQQQAIERTQALDQSQPSELRGESISLRQLLTLGITGGMVPCPAALVVLLSALSLHRVGLGLFLIVAFSLGLAAVLIVIGLLMVYARQIMARWRGDGAVVKRWLPMASAGFMLILGVGIAARAFVTTGIGSIVGSSALLTRAHLVSSLGIVLLGLFLGMRHSTDPDHVVAVSTIVSRERSIRHAALIGMLWGVGHTLTISVVGSAIILFGMVIPPRVGLSMEFSVAVMLILLGVLNLTGVIRWLTEKFTPAAQPLDASPQASSSTSQETVKKATFVGHGSCGERTGTISRAESSLLSSGASAPEVASTKVTASASRSSFGSVNRIIARFGSFQLLRPLFVGLVHGLAGSAAVALLVLSTIHSPLWAIAYLVVFGIGTVAGMMLMTTVIALPIAYTGNRFVRVGNYLGIASGIASTAFGLFLVYQIGLVDGLFTAQAHWIPR